MRAVMAIWLRGCRVLAISDYLDSCVSEKWCHVQWQIHYAIINLDVACMKNIRCVDVCSVLAAEHVERKGRVVLAAFDFNREYILSSADLGFRNERMVHLDTDFFGRDEDVLDVFTNGNESADFNVVESPVGDKVLCGFTHSRRVMNFVLDYYAVMFHKPDVGLDLQKTEDCIEIVEIFIKEFPHLSACPGEVCEEICLILILGELFRYAALADTSCALNQYVVIVGILVFLCLKSIVDFPFHRFSLISNVACCAHICDIKKAEIYTFTRHYKGRDNIFSRDSELRICTFPQNQSRYFVMAA